jgi:AcrR family transcriptional regulator
MTQRPPRTRDRDRAKGIFAALHDEVKERVKEHVHERLRQHSAHDTATRERLLEAAMRLFAKDGFRHVTVRDISREAGANLASVNYHFGDKLELYMSVVRAGIESVRDAVDAAMPTDPAMSAEEKLRHYLRSSFSRLGMPEERRSIVQRLFSHELMDPTPAAAVLIDEIIRPRLHWLSEVVGELMDAAPSDDRVRRCVSSIQAQFLLQASNPMRSVLFDSPRAQLDVEAEVEHIFAFSLAGIRAIAARGAARRPRR